MKGLALVLLLLVPAAWAQQKAPAASSQAIPGKTVGVFFALSVADVDTMSAWYRDKLGFRITTSGEAPNKIAKFALLESEGSILEMIQHREAKPRVTAGAHQIHGIFKAGFHVADLDLAYKCAKEKEIPIAYDLAPAKDVDLRTFTIRDPEGNLIQFFGR